MRQEEDFLFRDTVLVKGLTVEASIGVFEWEKQIKQNLVCDAELYSDFSAAAQSDAIEDAVDYAAVCSEIAELVCKQHYQLLEYLAVQVCEHLLSRFEIDAVRLVVFKPGAVANTETVGVKVFRSNINRRSSDLQSSNNTVKNGRC